MRVTGMLCWYPLHTQYWMQDRRSPVPKTCRYESWLQRALCEGKGQRQQASCTTCQQGHMDDIMSEINEKARYLRLSVEENNKRGTLYTYTCPNYEIWAAIWKKSKIWSTGWSNVSNAYSDLHYIYINPFSEGGSPTMGSADSHPWAFYRTA